MPKRYLSVSELLTHKDEYYRSILRSNILNIFLTLIEQHLILSERGTVLGNIHYDHIAIDVSDYLAPTAGASTREFELLFLMKIEILRYRVLHIKNLLDIKITFALTHKLVNLLLIVLHILPIVLRYLRVSTRNVPILY